MAVGGCDIVCCASEYGDPTGSESDASDRGLHLTEVCSAYAGCADGATVWVLWEGAFPLETGVRRKYMPSLVSLNLRMLRTGFALVPPQLYPYTPSVDSPHKIPPFRNRVPS